MMATALDKQSTLLAYFSHSYRASEKEINLFFWEILSKHNLYFTVDPQGYQSAPMDITYLEWMMRRCACFVAVIPYREDTPPYNCSPYQLFENGLAVRAKKPRLVFVEADLDESIFGVQPDEVCTFQRRAEFLAADRGKFIEMAEKLSQRVTTFSVPKLDLRKPVALLTDVTQGLAYDTTTIRAIRQAVRDKGYSYRIVNPTDFEQDFLFLQAVEQNSILITEIRSPHIAPDILGFVHNQCIPTIRICHLEDNEDKEIIEAAMHLSRYEEKWIEKEQERWPILLSKYKIGDEMEPIIFWQSIDELVKKIGLRLQIIAEKRDDLITEQEARDYFLRLGRIPGRVFISNAKAQNDFAYALKRRLQWNAVSWFHYKDRDAIPIGASDWLSEVIMEIRNSAVFIALIDSNYASSQWCMTELREALNLFAGGEIRIHAYVIEPDVPLPRGLTMMEGEFLYPLPNDEKVERIVDNTVAFLEKGRQVNLRPRDRDRIIQVLSKLPSFASPNERKTILNDVGLPWQLVDKVRTEASANMIAAGEIVDDLVAWKQEVKPNTMGLGLLLSHAMGLVDSIEEQNFLAGMIRGYGLMPDIKSRLEPSPPIAELGLAYYHQRKEMGTFESIQQGAPVAQQLERGILDASLYAISVNASADQENWQKTLQVVGSSLFGNKAFSSLLSKYQETLGRQAVRNERVGFCFATDGPGMRVPYEWAIVEGHRLPLCLSHPLRRFLVGPPESRSTIRSLLMGEVAIPLRVLLVAANTGGIPQVENEINEIYEQFCSLFETVGWPNTNITLLRSRAVTPARLELAIKTGGYHLLHFAGHGGYDADGKSVLQLFHDDEQPGTVSLSATILKNWITESDLRFVYLSSCRSASTEMPELSNEIRHFENIGQALVEALVPEVIGFVWPIEDSQSRLLATRFYKEYLRGFNASLALYQARKSFEEENRIWAAPVLIQQTDTPSLTPSKAG